MSGQSLRLRGPDVAHWLAARGWRASAEPRSVPEAYVDELSFGELSIRRIWQTPMALERTGGDLSDRHEASAILVADGDVRVRLQDGRRPTLRRHSSLIVAREHALVLSSASPTARIEVDWRPAGMDLASAPLLGADAESPAAAWSLLASCVNAALNAKMGDRHPGLGATLHALESLADALWLEVAAERTPVAAARPEDAFTRAMRILRRRAHEAGFTIAELAEETGVSRPHLTRVFRDRDCSPRAVLRKERLILAHRHLEAHPDATLAQTAAASGFSSARALSEALAAGGEQLASEPVL